MCFTKRDTIETTKATRQIKHILILYYFTETERGSLRVNG